METAWLRLHRTDKWAENLTFKWRKLLGPAPADLLSFNVPKLLLPNARKTKA